VQVIFLDSYYAEDALQMRTYHIVSNAGEYHYEIYTEKQSGLL
jgi:hypothetical protein